MSKLSVELLKESITIILAKAEEKPRKFVETVELQIGLKDYDTQRDKRFSGKREFMAGEGCLWADSGTRKGESTRSVVRAGSMVWSAVRTLRQSHF